MRKSIDILDADKVVSDPNQLLESYLRVKESNSLLDQLLMEIINDCSKEDLEKEYQRMMSLQRERISL